MKSFPIVKQTVQYSCGQDCMRIILEFYQLQISSMKLSALCPIGEQGTSLYDLIQGAKQLGFSALPLKCKLEDLVQTPLPLIAYMNNKHYLVVYEVSKQHIHVSDPARGLVCYSFDRFQEEWYLPDEQAGVLLVMEPKTLVKRDKSI